MWRDKKTIRRVVAVLPGISILIFLCFVVFNLIRKVERASVDNPVSISAVLPSEYHLISDKYADKLKDGVSYKSNNRNPVTVFHFDNKYLLVSYKIDLTSNVSLSKALVVLFN